MKILIVLISLLVCDLSFGQISGIYNGKDHASTIIYDDSTDFKKYRHKQIKLNDDSTFVFWSTFETFNSICIGCVDTIWVNGIWKAINDTVILTSKYKSDDFIRIHEFKTENKIKTFVYNTEYHCHRSNTLIINDSLKFDFECSKILTLEIEKIKTIKFVEYIGKAILYEKEYKPDPFNSSIFTFNFSWTKKDGNDSFFEGIKFLATNNSLIPITNNKLIEVEEAYKK